MHIARAFLDGIQDGSSPMIPEKVYAAIVNSNT